jgi:hypothetical protein
MRSNAYARARMLNSTLLTQRLQRRLSCIARRGRLRPHARYRGAQVARELSRIDPLLLDVLSDSAEHGRRYSADDLVRVIPAHSGNVAHSLRHSIGMITENLRKRGGSLWIFRLRRGFTMDGVRAALVRVRRHCSSHQRNRGINRPLCNDWIDAKPLTHLLDSSVAHLLLNLLLN